MPSPKLDINQSVLSLKGKKLKFWSQFRTKLENRSREEELAVLNARVQKALKQRDDEIARINEAAEQAQRRADYMEEMLDKQNKLLRDKKLKR